MRILDVESDKVLDNTCIYLTLFEAKDLMLSIENLLEDKLKHHEHVCDEMYKHEVTVTI